MRWNLRATAVRRGIVSAAELRRRLAGAGLMVSAGKVSGLWTGTPVTIRLDDLGVLCTVLACEPSDLLVREPSSVSAVAQPPGQAFLSAAARDSAAGTAPGRAFVPASGRSVGAVVCRSVPPA
ncbi:helix-turn-helix transcriptional regulator [Streptomyces sp. NPDC002935]|uniref:helix-turn-helix domain-containing protein n=1 Tax=Streptomyces sp. NPDC002935 TaxID=3154545 RepID=UPI0033B253B4